MPDANTPADLTEALSAPLGDLIAAVGRGVAEAQRSLDAQAVESVRAMYAGGDELLEALREIGYQPTWYRIPEVDAEVVISLSISGESLEAGGSAPGPSRLRLYATPVDATFHNKYAFNLDAASHLKFRIVPVPPSPQATGLKAVPRLVDKTFGEATRLLELLGIAWEHASEKRPADTIQITDSTPGTGELLGEGVKVVLKTGG